MSCCRCGAMTGPVGPQGPAGVTTAQVAWASSNVGNTTNPTFLRAFDDSTGPQSAAFEVFTEHVMAQAGTVQALVVRLRAAVLATNVTLTLRLNGADTALVATLLAGAQSGVAVGAVPYVRGDRFTVRMVTAAASTVDAAPYAAISMAST